MKITNYEPKYGDIDYAYGTEHQKYLIKFDMKLIEGLECLDLVYFNRNIFRGLCDLPYIGLEGHELRDKSRYECLLLEQEMHCIMPKLIFSKDIKKYVPTKTWWSDMALDWEWTVDYVYGGIDKFRNRLQVPKRNNYSDLLLGSGYTSAIMPNDGSYSLLPYLIEMDNGDYLYLKGFEWHNK